MAKRKRTKRIKRLRPARKSSARRPKTTPAGARSDAAITNAPTALPNPDAPFVIAVLNSNQDVLRLIRSVLEDEGYTVATEHIVSFKDGETNLTQFFANHRPSVVIYDLAPPYKENWNFLQLLQKIPDIAAIPFVLTTVNKAALEDVVGETRAFEILGTRDDLAPLIEEVNRSIRSRRHRQKRVSVSPE